MLKKTKMPKAKTKNKTASAKALRWEGAWLLQGTEGRQDGWNKERKNTVSSYSKMLLRETTVPLISEVLQRVK